MILGVSAVALGIAVVVGLAVAVGNGDIEVSNLGDHNVNVGTAERLARRVAADGPFILADVSPNKKRAVYLQHRGRDHDRGWFAIDAGNNACPLEWSGDDFADCDGTRYPADGKGRTRYKTWVEDGRVYIDLGTRLP